MGFPTSPSDGQIYNGWRYNASEDRWDRIATAGAGAGGATLEKGTSFPSTDPTAEEFFYRTDLEVLYMWSTDASAWIDVSSDGIYNDVIASTTFKNAIINGDMRISQRGTSWTGAANGYNIDRWNYEDVGSSVVNIAQDSDVPNEQFQ